MAKITGQFYPAMNQSIVTIKDKHGIYTGIARLHPDDTPNEITGCTIAEKRAFKKRLKARCNNLRIKIKTLKSFEKEITNYAPYECENSLIIDRLHITINSYQLELKEVLTAISDLQYEMQQDKKIRGKIKEKIKNNNLTTGGQK